MSNLWFHAIARCCSVLGVVAMASFVQISYSVSADEPTPESENEDNPHKIEQVGEEEPAWEETEDDKVWQGTWRTTGGVDDEGQEFCTWEWTKTFTWEEANVPFTVTYGAGGQWVTRKYATVWAGGARFGGSAKAHNRASNTSTTTSVSVAADGSVDVQLISKPDCEVCEQEIIVTTLPRFKANIDEFDAPLAPGLTLTAESAGIANVLATHTGAHAKTKGAVAAGVDADHEISVGGVTIPFNVSPGTDSEFFQTLDSRADDISSEIVTFAGTPYMKVHASGWASDDAKGDVSLLESYMNTTILARCKGCCSGGVSIYVNEGWTD